jgi:hypothetical protein
VRGPRHDGCGKTRGARILGFGRLRDRIQSRAAGCDNWQCRQLR